MANRSTQGFTLLSSGRGKSKFKCRLLGKPQVASLLGVTIRTIDRMIQAGRLPIVKVPTGSPKGYHIKFTLEDIDAFIDKERIRA
jgi:excisionase family DNA binding protein